MWPLVEDMGRGKRGRGGGRGGKQGVEWSLDLLRAPHPLADIGVNLTHRQLAGDMEQVLERCRDASVLGLFLTGTSVASSQRAARFVRSWTPTLHELGLRAWSTAGVHPHDAKSCGEDTLHELSQLLDQPGVVAVGECGLDYNRMFSPAEVQVEWFRKQVRLACERDLPLFLHERDAHSDFVAVLDEELGEAGGAATPRRCCVHCFTGSASELRAYLDRDFYIGITGWITDPRRGKHLLELIPQIPQDRLMIETDAPFLAPRNMREGVRVQRNEPCLLPYVLQAVAECLGKDAMAVAQQLQENTERFFGVDLFHAIETASLP